MFVFAIWMAIANNIIPNTFLSVVAVCGVILAANQSIDLSSTKMMMALTIIPPSMLAVSNSALSEMMVVKVPAPASRGKAIGTILPEAASPGSSLNNLIPKIISIPIKSITIEPAKAKEEISMPNNFNMLAPKNKKAIIITVAKPVTTDGVKRTPSFFIVISTGILPSISMTENKMTLTDNNAAKFISYPLIILQIL